MKKKSLFIVLLLLVGMNVIGQNHKNEELPKHVIGISPLTLIVDGVKVKYETPVAQYISAGSFLKATLWGGDTEYKKTGVRLEPFARYYFKENLNGFYGQIRAVVGYVNLNPTIETEYSKKQNYMDFGGGVGIGWQYVFPRNNHWSIDFGIGFQILSSTKEEPDPKDFDLEKAADTLGRLVDGQLTVSYRF